MTIMQANQSDLYNILELQYLAYQSEAQLLNNPNIPPLKQTLDDLTLEFEKGIVLKTVDEDEAIVGSVRAYSENNTLYIGKLIVRPDLQGQGIGTKLLKEIERVCPQKRYEFFTSSKSIKNISLYERLGYKKFNEKFVNKDLCFIYFEKIQLKII